MKRSEINAALREMEQMVREYRFALPPFCGFTPEEWAEKGHDYDEIRDNMLGWDITDYGMGNFDKMGFSLITLRNGNLKLDQYTKTYAEKLLYIKEGQYSPMHFHWSKMEDIINRGGGNVLIRVYHSTPDEDLDREREVHVHVDGREMVVPAGTQVRLTPGESITICPYLYHDFTVEPGSGPVLLGEVSQCNDDNTDNRFYEQLGRFPTIEEDEPPYRLLCSEYPAARE
ncbi:MAG TPA: D-lyxose/D-mannose family sugar isomerase [Candidatus Lawsonibacter pullicola]|nr:D-lyxose/D-mannose family sugar isomerase [Oscillospiraceae bacterium]HIW28304.1 D-lyxose/D-mannose family sugar isomerase [Candidatus Lawsonibacter pullicola]